MATNVPVQQLLQQQQASAPPRPPECDDPSLIPPPDGLRDLHGFHAIELPEWFYWLLGLTILGLIGYWVYQKFFNEPKAPELTIYQKTVRELNEISLHASSKDFYLQLSEVVRRYIELDLELEAMDKTIEELLPKLKFHPLLQTSQVLLMKETFERGDLAKFARSDVPVEEKKKDQMTMISIITEINAARELRAAEEEKLKKQGLLEKDVDEDFNDDKTEKEEEEDL